MNDVPAARVARPIGSGGLRRAADTNQTRGPTDDDRHPLNMQIAF